MNLMPGTGTEQMQSSHLNDKVYILILDTTFFQEMFAADFTFQDIDASFLKTQDVYFKKHI